MSLDLGKKGRLIFLSVLFGADDEARTRYLHLGKVALYRMSYIRIYGASDRNRTNDTGDFQSPALPTELQRQIGDLDRDRTDDL